MRIFEPEPGVLAFYDGRTPGRRFVDAASWVEADLALGTTSYAIVEGDSALVYDTHVSIEHGNAIRAALVDRDVRRFTVVLSHWHLDHIAGTAAFADCEVIANERTARILAERRTAITSGTELGPPAIDPMIAPTRTFAERETVRVGATDVELVAFEIHSPDATVLWLPGSSLLLAGDTLEDTVTYVDEPDRLNVHLSELDRLRELGPRRILPSHGDPELISAGGYGPDLIDATQDYIHTLLRLRDERELVDVSLEELIASSLARGALTWHPDYEAVHRQNVDAVCASTSPP